MIKLCNVIRKKLVEIVQRPRIRFEQRFYEASKRDNEELEKNIRRIVREELNSSKVTT